jgi:hypothetical protein
MTKKFSPATIKSTANLRAKHDKLPKKISQKKERKTNNSELEKA